MHMFRNVAIAPLLCLAAASVAVVAAGGEARPFEVVLDGHANPVPTPDPCVLINTETATGTATHLGLVTWMSEETVNLCSNPEGGDVSGTFVIVAANGDELRGSYETLAHLDFEAGRIAAVGRFRIEGGTGRFAGAGGDGAIAADGDLLPPFAFTGSLSGWMAY